MATPSSPGPSRESGMRTTPVAIDPGEDSAGARLRRNPGAWGVALGAATVLVSLFLVWIEATNHATGETKDVRLISVFSGQTLFFAALLTVGAGLAVAMVTSTGWRIAWAVAAVLLSSLLVGAAAWAIFDPAGFIKRAADAQLFATLTTQWEMRDASARLSAALASGTLTASARIGAFVGLVGGGLAMLGALLSFAPRRTPAR
jgi:hypothetical protein